jgi:hypothetical protein
MRPVCGIAVRTALFLPDDPPHRIQLGNYTLEVAFLNPQKTLGERVRWP